MEMTIDPILILAAFIALGYIIKFIFNAYIIRFAKKTKTKIDDIIVEAVKIPIIVIPALIGLNIALQPDYVTLPDFIAPHISLIFELLIAVIIIFTVAKITSGLIKYYGVVRPSIKTIVPTVDKIAKALIAFLGFMVILNILGVPVTAPLAAMGIGGIAIAFALQSTLNDFLSGVYIMADRPIRTGDYIELETGQKGYVTDIGWRSTRIRELPNNIIVIPNSKLAGSIVTNYYMPEREMACLVQVGVSYDSDLAKVEKVTLDVAKKVLSKVPGGIKEFDPFIRYHTFSDFSINFTVILRVSEFVDKYLLTHEFVKELHKRYNKEGIEIPFPIRTVYMKRER
jgi:small-conductance mechanosensitive channel